MRFGEYINEAQFRDILKHVHLDIGRDIIEKTFYPIRKLQMAHRQKKKLGAVSRDLITVGKSYIISHPKAFKSKKTMDEARKKDFLKYCIKEGEKIVDGADIPDEAKKIMKPKLKEFYTKLVWDRVWKMV